MHVCFIQLQFDSKARGSVSMSDAEKKNILELLQVYRTLPALWNMRTPEYNDRKIKQQQYDILLNKFRQQYPNADKIDLTKKLNSLRTNYRREKKRKVDLESQGKRFETGLYYFETLSFLMENDTFEIQTPPAIKKKKSKSDPDELLELATQRLKKSDDYSQTLANVWASEFRLASEEQRFFAKKAIDDILFEARLGTLHRNSVKINENPLTDHSEYNPCHSKIESCHSPQNSIIIERIEIEKRESDDP